MNDSKKGRIFEWKTAPRYDTCFVCGKKNACGLNLSFETAEGRAKTLWTPREDHCGYKGVVHGGIAATLLDEAMGWAGWQTYHLNFFTVELKVRYKKPLMAGVQYAVEAEMTHGRGKFYMAAGRIIGPEGEVYVEGEAKYFVRENL